MTRNTFLLFCGLVLATSDSVCQEAARIDSLETLLETQGAAERFPVLYELAFQYLHRDNEHALELMEKAQAAAKFSGDSVSIVKSMRVAGQVLLLLERTAPASQVLSQALPIAERNSLRQEEYYIESSLARIDAFAGRYDAALKRYYALLPVANELDGGEDYPNLLNSIGLIHYKLKDYSTAIDYYEKSIDKFVRLDRTVPASYYANLALCYAHLGDLANATSFAKRSLVQCGENCAEPVKMNAQYALGVIYLGEGKSEQAEKHFLSSYQLAVNQTTLDSNWIIYVCLLTFTLRSGIAIGLKEFYF